MFNCQHIFFQFWPETGPTKGGTKLTIQGINLGKTFDDIKDGVKVAGIKCIPDPASYIPARMYVNIIYNIQII